MKLSIKFILSVLKEVRANFWPMSKNEEVLLSRETKELAKTFTSYKSEWDLYEKWQSENVLNVGPPTKIILSPKTLLLTINVRMLTTRFYYDGATFCPVPFWMSWGFSSERHALGTEYKASSRYRYSDQELVSTAEEVIQNLPELEARIFNRIMSNKNERAAFIVECASMIVERDTHSLTLVEDNGDSGEPRTPLQLAKRIVGYPQ